MTVDQPWGGTWIDLTPAQLDADYRGSCVILQRPAVTIATPVDERTQPDIDHNAMCGSAWLSWSLACVGINVSAETLEQWMRATYGEPSVHGGTTAVQLASAAQHFGCPAEVSSAPPSTLIGGPIGVCVWCTPYAVPCTPAQSRASAPPYGLGHWIGPVPTISPTETPLWDVLYPGGPAIMADADSLQTYVLEQFVAQLGRCANPTDLTYAVAYIQAHGLAPWFALLSNSVEANAWRARLGA